MTEDQTPAPEAPGEGRDRKAFVLESALGPESLVGSWVLAFQGEEVMFQGLVVGEPQPGLYMVEEFDYIDLESKVRGGKHQRLFPIEAFLDGDFRFYDNEVWVRRVLEAYDSKRSEV